MPHPLEQHNWTHLKSGADPLPWGSTKEIYYAQDAEPTIPDDTFAFWKDTNLTKYYLIWRIGGIQVKTELT